MLVLLKENVLAIIVNGKMVARKDYKEAIEFLNKNNFQYRQILHDGNNIDDTNKYRPGNKATKVIYTFLLA